MKQKVNSLLKKDERILSSVRKNPVYLFIRFVGFAIPLGLALWLLLGANAYTFGLPPLGASEFDMIIYDILIAVKGQIVIRIIIYILLIALPLYKFIIKFYKYFADEMVITDQKVIAIIVADSFLVRSVEIPFENISTVEVLQGFWGNIFNYGSIFIKTEGGDLLSAYIVEHLKDVEMARKNFKEVLEEYKPVKNTIQNEENEETKEEVVIEESKKEEI